MCVDAANCGGHCQECREQRCEHGILAAAIPPCHFCELNTLRSKLEALESAARGDGFDDETVRKLAAVMAERDALASRLGALQTQYSHTLNGMIAARADREELQRRLDEIAKEVEFLTADRNNERNMRINAQAVRLRAEKDLAETESRLSDCETALMVWDDSRASEYWLRHNVDAIPTIRQDEITDEEIAAVVERRVRICGAPLSSSRSKNCLLPEGHSGSHQFSTSPE